MIACNKIESNVAITSVIVFNNYKSEMLIIINHCQNVLNLMTQFILMLMETS